jgi:glycine C-acetyltransferase
VVGIPCALLMVIIGNEMISRLVSRIMMDRGVHVNGIEYPVVKIGQARLRVSLFPQHTKEHMDTFVRVFEESLAQAKVILDASIAKYEADCKEEQTAKL